MIPVKALLFDLDGTLIDSKRDLAQSVQFLQEKWGFPLSTETEVAGFIGDGVTRLIERALPGISDSELAAAVEFFKRYYRLHCLDQTRLYPQVRDVLLRFRNKSLAVVTNKPLRISRYILECLGIASRFQMILGGDSLRTKKPEPEVITSALRSMDIQNPRQGVFIGDGLNDVLAGRAAGTLTAGILSDIGSREKLVNSHPDFLLLNIAELMRIFN